MCAYRRAQAGVGKARISDHSRIRRALGHRADVLRLQIAGVRPRTNPSALSRPSCPSDPRPAPGQALVMALALYWAVSTGMWDYANNPTPAEKTTGPSACQARPRKALLVHTRPPPRRQSPPPMPPTPKTLGRSAKLMDAQGRAYARPQMRGLARLWGHAIERVLDSR
jgi:hypothetical protein